MFLGSIKQGRSFVPTKRAPAAARRGGLRMAAGHRAAARSVLDGPEHGGQIKLEGDITETNIMVGYGHPGFAGGLGVDWKARVELFEQLRQEHEFGVGTIAGVAAKFGVHRRMVRQAIAGSR